MKRKIAVASQGTGGLEDTVSPIFGRCRVFTIVEVTEDGIGRVEVKKSPWADVSHGAGPLTSQMIDKLSVKLVIAGNFGPTVSTLLGEAGIEKAVEPTGTKIGDAIRRHLRS